MLLGVAAHLLRVVAVGADLLRERQDLLDINGALVGREMEDVREICGEIRIRYPIDEGDPSSTILPGFEN